MPSRHTDTITVCDCVRPPHRRVASASDLQLTAVVEWQRRGHCPPAGHISVLKSHRLLHFRLRPNCPAINPLQVFFFRSWFQRLVVKVLSLALSTGSSYVFQARLHLCAAAVTLQLYRPRKPGNTEHFWCGKFHFSAPCVLCHFGKSNHTPPMSWLEFLH